METTIKTYTTLELSPILHASKRTLDRLCREGEIKAIKIERHWIISENAVQDYIKKMEGGKRR